MRVRFHRAISLRPGALDAAWLRRAGDSSPARFPDSVRAALRPRAVRQRRRTMQTRRALCLMAPALPHRLPMVRRWLARRRACSAAKPARARDFQRRLAVGRCRRSPRRERRDQCDVAGRDQNAVTAIGKIEPQAAAGRKPAGRRAKALQSLQPDGAACRQPGCEPRDLPPVPSAGPKVFSASAAASAAPNIRTPAALAHRIVCRRPSTATRAGGSSRRPPVADRRARAPEIPHLPSRLT